MGYINNLTARRNIDIIENAIENIKETELLSKGVAFEIVSQLKNAITYNEQRQIREQQTEQYPEDEIKLEQTFTGINMVN